MVADGIYDLLVIGGGVNGTSIARAAAVAGQRVLLVEMGDLAQATSSASTKLIHGGLRYLEQYAFRLVHESLAERAIMLRTAPHIVRPIEFRLPHVPAMRPWPIMRLGLWLYDLFALGGGLPRSRAIRIDDPALAHAGAGFSYWDAAVDDSRLVVLNALDAHEAGADIRTRTRLVSARREDGLWTAQLDDGAVRARRLVNAAGPWVEALLHGAIGVDSASGIRLVRGSHIIVPRRLAGEHAWLFQQPDRRIVFAIPYLDDATLIGTTDMPVSDPTDSAVSDEEVDYLLAAANLYLRVSIGRDDIIGRYAGIRALFDDGKASASTVTRDYRLELDRKGAPLLSVFGGKITTARNLAEQALERLGLPRADTRTRPLPGGDFDDFPAFLASVRSRWPFLDAATALRMARAYGTRIADVLGDAAGAPGLGCDFGAGLSEREVDYLVATEWARSAEDIVWRRTKLGYRLAAEQIAALDAYLKGAVR